MEALLIELAKQGVLAVVTAVAVWFALRKDRQVSALYDRLAEKSETYLQAFADLNREMCATVNALADALDLEVDTDVAIPSPTKTDPGRKTSRR